MEVGSKSTNPSTKSANLTFHCDVIEIIDLWSEKVLKTIGMLVPGSLEEKIGNCRVSDCLNDEWKIKGTHKIGNARIKIISRGPRVSYCDQAFLRCEKAILWRNYTKILKFHANVSVKTDKLIWNLYSGKWNSCTRAFNLTKLLIGLIVFYNRN